MISQRKSKQVRIDSWLLKLLSRDMKTKTKKKINQQTITKYNPEIDRWEIPILNLICHINLGNE